MYILVLFLDILGAVILTAIAFNLSLDSLFLLLFFCLFPLGFALMSEFIKVKALQTGTGSDQGGMIWLIGIALILIILILGAAPQLLDFWNGPLCTDQPLDQYCRQSWTRIIIIILAIEAVLLLVFPIFKEVRDRRRVQYDKLKDESLI